MAEKIKNIGKISGKVLLFGGAYSNLQALQKLKEIAETEGISAPNIISTGDLVGYCAQPDETCELAEKWCIHAICGNVEIQLRTGKEDCGCDYADGGRCDTFARIWYPFAVNQLSQYALDWMLKLPEFITFQYLDKKVVVVHGSYHYTSEYIFKSTPWAIKQKSFDDTGADIIIAGHSGLPFHDERANKLWLNPGVIGMPANDGTTRVWYMILDSSKDQQVKFTHHSMEYEHQLTSKLMTENKLPPEYVKTLNTGLWDNNEILPEQETAQQGIPIAF